MADETETPPKLDRTLMEQLMFGAGTVRRFTQDSPVLPDVWLQYVNEAANEGSRGQHRAAVDAPNEGPSTDFPAVKVLLTPFREASAGEVRRVLHDRLVADRQRRGHQTEKVSRIIYNQTTIAATLYFEDLVRVVIPMTDWWERMVRQLRVTDMSVLNDPNVRTVIAAALVDPEHRPKSVAAKEQYPPPRELPANPQYPPDLLWLIRVVGAMAMVRDGAPLPAVFGRKNGVAIASEDDWRPIVDAVANLIAEIPAMIDDPPPEDDADSPVAVARERARIYSVSLNRQATATVSRSTLAIKADAARRLFNISCSQLAWAIIDSGVDAHHGAFRARHEDNGKTDVPFTEPFEKQPSGKWANQTRIVATYDFTQIDLLLDPADPKQPDRIRHLRNDPAVAAKVEEALDELNKGLSRGRTIDWKIIAPFLQIPHDDMYVAPPFDHGTHVAGILAGDWRAAEQGKDATDLIGVCPDLKLYDLRVLDAQGRGDEFAVMAALQFIRYLNSTNDYVSVHGVNLSLSIPHDIANYACGRTPVCDECERVVSAGVVVVAAAGNQGYRKLTTEEGTTEAYNSISITDPGNADAIITVGATHRFRPHTYGVSYFSSRGPTGDGRIKPDLVAPGEKITAPLPNGQSGIKDGTSMAAPHVSGAAALLMARHDELVGRPARIKEILKSTATDLGRERYFQGAGMLDVLRALQSV
ncbi:MAG: serine protease AprX [Thermoanaerobaculia bacterium]|nr:serine protease AprX [Thermoanaerobaculia bacterium]